MYLSTRQLEAFMAVARTHSFSRAAQRLCVTQSALSQRIKKLEAEMGATLLIRSPAGVRLTDVGLRTLRYCQARAALEADVFADLDGATEGELAGVLRVASYSSVLRSVVIPALAPLLREHDRIQYEFIRREIHELPDLLRQAEADFVILDHRLGWARTTEVQLGVEEYVAVESRRHTARAEVYLDHSPEDRLTAQFFAQQDEVPDYRRSYLDDVYGILDGVAAGLGRAVVSRHLLAPTHGVSIVARWRPMRRDVVLHHLTLPYYTRLQQVSLQALQERCAELLQPAS